MPIFKFHGVEQKEVEKYYEKVEEIAEIAVANLNKIVFISDCNSKILSKSSDAIYVTIDWMARPDKQELIANHVVENFKHISSNIFVKFEELNGFLYFNGKLV